eukprot:Gb_14814 [translate_table: standard]
MVSFLNAILYGAGGIVCTCMVLLVTFQEKLVYVPVIPGTTKGYPITPARLRLKYEDIWLTSSDGVRLHAWFIKLLPDCRVESKPKPKPSCYFSSEPRLPGFMVAGTEVGVQLFYFFKKMLAVSLVFSIDSVSVGNYYSDIAHRLEFIRILLQTLKCNVFMLSYRGYGASDGYPSQHGIINDAQAALDYLLQRTDIDTSRIVVFGRSLGGAVGAALVKNNPNKSMESIASGYKYKVNEVLSWMQMLFMEPPSA